VKKCQKTAGRWRGGFLTHTVYIDSVEHVGCGEAKTDDGTTTARKLALLDMNELARGRPTSAFAHE